MSLPKAKSEGFCSGCFKSLGVKAKLSIYNYLLENGSSTVSKIVEIVGLTQPTISYHLHDMQSHGLLKSNKLGKEVFYEVNEMCPFYNCTCVLHGIKFPGNKGALFENKNEKHS